MFGRKNGAGFLGTFDVSQSSFSNQLNLQNGASAPVQVQEGDYFELAAWQSSGGSLNFGASDKTRTWFSLEYIQ
jgi:hypothetical protein